MEKKSNAPSNTRPPNARRAAAKIVEDVVRGKRLDDALRALERFNTKADSSDKAFAAAIALDALRHYYLIDKILRHFMKRPLPKSAKTAHAFLVIGVAQLLYMNVAPHAAIGESVSAFAQTIKNAPQKNLINAVLRTIDRAKEAGDLPALTPLDALPLWWQKNWQAAYGADAAQIISHCLTQPPLDICFQSQAAREDMQAQLKDDTYEVLCSDALRLRHKGEINTLPDFKKGSWWVQDIAATLPARLLLDIRKQNGQDDKDILDLCAAPGGKALQLAAYKENVVCVDYDEARLKLLRANFRRTGLTAKTIKADILDWHPDQKWHYVIVDAPCSATGTLRRNPDILLHRRQSDIDKAAATQKRLLAAAAELTEGGGTLLYCVCALEPQEGEAQIADFLASHKDFALHTDLAIPAGFAPHISDYGIRIFPNAFMNSCDGFFIAPLHKKA